MRVGRMLRLFWILCLGVILASAFSAIAALNNVPASHADIDTIPITANDLKPPQCSGINLVNIRTGNGTNANDLILGSAGNDNMNAQGGDDIILAGAGNDILIGNRGDDVLYGQSGDDDLSGGRQTDICDGGTGTDTSDGTCETELNIP